MYCHYTHAALWFCHFDYLLPVSNLLYDVYHDKWCVPTVHKNMLSEYQWFVCINVWTTKKTEDAIKL